MNYKQESPYIDPENPVVQLCIQGTRAEFQGNLDEARALYWRAWKASATDYEACIAAHYVAHLEENPQAALQWNLEALRRAESVGDDRVKNFYSSLVVNVGNSYERLGNQDEADLHYRLAAELELVHNPDF